MTSEEAEPRTVRVNCYVDGFNLYHGIKEHSKARKYRWLNLWSFAQGHLIPGHTLQRVIYFTSLPPWSEAKSARHERYIAALKSVGVEVVLGRFQRDEVFCHAQCKQMFYRYNEKLTDVNISTAMLRDSVKNEIDWAYLISGDADQSPALRTMKELAPSVRSMVLLPPRRNSTELSQTADRYRPLGARDFVGHLLPEIIVNNGRTIRKPDNW